MDLALQIIRQPLLVRTLSIPLISIKHLLPPVPRKRSPRGLPASDPLALRRR